jgi:hypothetical protein
VITSTSIEDIVGSAFGLKMFCDDNIKVIGVVKNSVPRLKKVGSIYKNYVDKLYNIRGFNAWLSEMGT